MATGKLENPLKFFLLNGYAPPFQHVLEVFDPNNVSRAEASVEKEREEPIQENGSLLIPLSGDAPKGSGIPFSISLLLPEGDTTEDTTFAIGENGNTPLPNSEKDTKKSVNNHASGSQVGGVVLFANDQFRVNTVDVIPTTDPNYSCGSESAEATSVCESHWAENEENSVIAEGSSNGETVDRNFCSTPTSSSNSSIVCTKQYLPLSSEVLRNRTVQNVNLSRSAAVATLYSTMKRYLLALKNEVKHELAASLRSQETHPFYRVYAHFKTLQVYSQFLDELQNMSENLAVYQYKPVPHCHFREEQQEGLLRLSCSHRVDGSLVISAEYATGHFEDYRSMDDKDATYAFNYYEKVEETLLSSGRADLLERFEQILRNFDETQDRVAVLYYQIEDLLGESFPQLVDTFLTFLLPGQAAEVGKFMEHFILTNMGDFLEKLNVFFAKQPSQIKKVYACLNELSNEEDVTMEQVKLKVLPLLKGSTLLTEWFLQLFPGERPPESPVSDYEHIGLKKHALNESCDAGSVYEHVSYVETLPEVPEVPCTSNAIRYIQGRIFQGALPARLTFLANNCLTKQAVDQPSSKEAHANGDSLCDDSTLMAHAIRLNPVVHCPKNLTYADVVHMLLNEGEETDAALSQETSVANSNVEEESSKLGTTSKKLTPKLPLKKRYNSPSSRKAGSSPGDEKSSPGNNKETVTPKKLATSVTIPPESKALASARKLKSLIDAPQANTLDEQQVHELGQVDP
uniref:Uncharacterized protein n=1 Tax=Anopheles epiroticus TaxID=199890 RepID=A0A182PTC6_9DIPT